jgi:hypothetical protein
MTVTASVDGSQSGGPPDGMNWAVQYDDATRAVTASASGTGWCLVTIQVTASVSRTVAFYPAATGLGVESRNTGLSSRMPAADFRLVADGSTVTLASGINPNQVSRIVGKVGQAVGTLPASAEWSPA